MTEVLDNATISRAVAAHQFDRHDDDYYVEPDWLDDAIFATESFKGAIYDPACGSGRIVRAARRSGRPAYGSDIVSRCAECGMIGDFLSYEATVANVVTNPPFKIAREFVDHALRITTGKIVMILPARFVWGEKRSRWLAATPLRRVLAVVPRPSMPPGTLIEAGFKPGGGKQDFVVCVWITNYDGKPEFGFIGRPAAANDNVEIAEDAA